MKLSSRCYNSGKSKFLSSLNLEKSNIARVIVNRLRRSQILIAVTGASGFIGSYVKKKLESSNEVVDLLSKDNISKFKLNKASNSKAINAEMIICCALDRETLSNNLEGMKLLVSENTRPKPPKIIFISSFSSNRSALSNYGKSKFEIETYLEEVPDAVVIRTGLVVSAPRQGFALKLQKLANFPLVLIVPSNINLYITPIDNLVTLIESIVKGQYVGTNKLLCALKEPQNLANYLKHERTRIKLFEIKIPLTKNFSFLPFLKLLPSYPRLLDSIKSIFQTEEFQGFKWVDES